MEIDCLVGQDTNLEADIKEFSMKKYGVMVLIVVLVGFFMIPRPEKAQAQIVDPNMTVEISHAGLDANYATMKIVISISGTVVHTDTVREAYSLNMGLAVWNRNNIKVKMQEIIDQQKKLFAEKQRVGYITAPNVIKAQLNVEL